MSTQVWTAPGIDDLCGDLDDEDLKLTIHIFEELTAKILEKFKAKNKVTLK